VGVMGNDGIMEENNLMELQQADSLLTMGLRTLSDLHQRLHKAHSGLHKDLKMTLRQRLSCSDPSREIKEGDTVLICGHPDEDINGKTGTVRPDANIGPKWPRLRGNNEIDEDYLTVELRRPPVKSKKSVSEKAFLQRFVAIPKKHLLKKVAHENELYWRKKFKAELKHMSKDGYTNVRKNLRVLRKTADEALSASLPESYLAPRNEILPPKEKLVLLKLLQGVTEIERHSASIVRNMVTTWENITAAHVCLQQTVLSTIKSLSQAK